MKRKGKIWFFVIAILIVVLAYTTVAGVSTRYGDTVNPIVKGIEDIRFGIDIRGGVDVTFAPADGTDATQEQLDSAKSIIEQRLIGLGVTDYEVYEDVNKSRIILRFPWQADETEFNPETAIQELAATALLTFREGNEADAEGNPTGTTAENIILQGSDIVSATADYGNPSGDGVTGENYVTLTLSPEGSTKFAEATGRLAVSSGTISIWMDNDMISAPTVNSQISDGNAVITGDFTAEAAKDLADKINGGALPFALSAESYSTISPTLGSQALQAMLIAGIIALVLVALYMVLSYRLVGFVSTISLVGQVAATLALISGYFVVFNSFTLTLPGIAGIVLAIGIGVDANVITGERIKEEIRSGKKLDAAIRAGYQRGLAPIIDGNVTVLIVAVILMGAFGPTDSFFAKLLTPIFFAFGSATAGTIYSFGYTLLIGVVLNMVFGVFCTRAMLTSISKIKAFRNPVLYGGLPKGKAAKTPKLFNVVGNYKKFFTISGAIFAVILVFSLVFGVRADVQFKGGAIVNYAYQGDVDMATVQPIVNAALGEDATIQDGDNAITGTKTLTITLPGNQTLDVATLETLGNELEAAYPENSFEQLEVNNVSPIIGREFLLKSIIAVLAASLLILLYIAIRFRKIGGWKGGVTAVVALLHDLIIVFGVFVLLRIPLSGNFIAALLTILGYSINDTVVIYDRVRENRGLYGRRMSFSENVKLSINQSLRRSINTTVTTVLALGSVCVLALIFGITSVFTFAFPIIIGMVSGVYSTVCIAGPLWVLWEKRTDKKQKRIPKKSENVITAADVLASTTAKQDLVSAEAAVEAQAEKAEDKKPGKPKTATVKKQVVAPVVLDEEIIEIELGDEATEALAEELAEEELELELEEEADALVAEDEEVEIVLVEEETEEQDDSDTDAEDEDEEKPGKK